MQDPTNGVKRSEQKLNITTIPHVMAGEFVLMNSISSVRSPKCVVLGFLKNKD